MKKLAILMVLVLVLGVLFTGCESSISNDEAEEKIYEFLSAIVDENYKKAQSCLHPDKDASVKKFIEDFEKDTGLDFQNGIEIEGYTGYSSSVYDSEFDGSTYELTLDAVIDDVELEFEVLIVDNDAGYGIYGFDINM